MPDHPPLWSRVLQDIIKSTSERQRLMAALSVSNMTLTRWASGESNPQRTHLIRLVQVVQQQHRETLLNALEVHYPDIQSWLRDDTSEEVSSDFFAQVLSARTTTTDSLRFWRISEMILKQALMQLDPHRLGMGVKFIQCMPPSQDGKIRSLRERSGKGSSPWATDLEHDVLFLGLESLSGYTVELRHVLNDSDLRKRKAVPAVRDTFEISAAAHPIRMGKYIAGCLLASSTQEGYFTQRRLTLLAAFSDLMSLALDKDQFYPSELLELGVMPRPATQRPILATFRQRVTKRLQQSRDQQINQFVAEQQVWQELETELFALPVDYSTESFDSHETS